MIMVTILDALLEVAATSRCALPPTRWSGSPADALVMDLSTEWQLRSQ